MPYGDYTIVNDLIEMEGVVRTHDFGEHTFIVPVNLLLSNFDSLDDNEGSASDDEDILTLAEVLDEKRGDDQYYSVRESIAASGFTEPIYSSDTCMLLDGHHRLAAAIDLGYTSVPVEFTWAPKERI